MSRRFALAIVIVFASGLLLLNVPASSFAQAPPVVGPQVRVDPLGGTAAANETTCSASEFDPLQAVAGWNDYREPGQIRSGFSLTFDGGQTWSDFLIRPPAPNRSSVEGDPMTAFDNRTGTLFAGAISFFSGSGGVYVARKFPHESTFQPAVMASTASGADKCWMAAGPLPGNPDSTRVYVAYNLGLLRSDDLGMTWTGPTSIDSGLGFLPRVGPNGELYVLYWDFGSGIWLRRSFNGGNSYDPRIRVATRLDVWGVDGTRFPGTFRVPPLAYLAVDPNDGTLYVVWFDTTNMVGNNRNVDLYLTKSTNQGTTWSTPHIINADNTPPGDQFFPWVEVDRRGRLHMIFHDTRNVVQNDNQTPSWVDEYYSYSDDGGDTWTEVRLTPESFNGELDGRGLGTSFIGDYSGLAVAGTRVYPAYLSNQNGDSDIFSHVITSGGVPGDMNCDGTLDGADIDPFFLALGFPDDYAQQFPDCEPLNGDITGDGTLDGADIDPFFACLGGNCP